MTKNTKLIGILALATVVVGGAAWLTASGGPAVGEGKTVHMLATPT